MVVAIRFRVMFFDEFFGFFNHLAAVRGGAAGDCETGELAYCCARESVHRVCGDL